jgi:restriction system protein
MRPVLVMLADGGEHTARDIREHLAREFSLSQDELDALLPSGRAKTFANRVGWALTYLYRTKLLERPRRSVYRITPRGQEVMTENPGRVDLRVLSQFEELQEFRGRSQEVHPENPTEVLAGAGESAQTPEEQIEMADRVLRLALAADLMERVKEQSPAFFEQLVLDVLRAMGYGGKHADAAERLGQSGDEGVDGVIREDELGLDLIYVQAKRWQNPVGRPEIQKFFGALHGKRASKGVFITTSAFTAEAASYAQTVTPRVILVDGIELARLMIEYGVGVTTTRRTTSGALTLTTSLWMRTPAPARLNDPEPTSRDRSKMGLLNTSKDRLL